MRVEGREPRVESSALDRPKNPGQLSLLLTALSFLSVIPVRPSAEIDPKALGQSMRYFPLVGLIFGLILAAAAYLVSAFLPLSFLGISLLILLKILDRGMHLDGLADSADGLLGGRTREDILRIMSDSSVGAFGAAAIVLVLLAKYSLFFSLHLNRTAFAVIVLLPALSRWSVVYAAYRYRPARSGGMAKTFSNSLNFKELAVATLIIVLASAALLPPIKSVIILAWTILTTILIAAALTRKIGGMTGDILGALIEIQEAVVLAGALILILK